ncbi:MAG TPA: cysteine dioxygenase family protein [Myxococcales bacterium]|jgi:predicted metal-dependent enzyme (double-stranded beta helix superfamily)|nr:cysteine dioxygenase family protein [Myxococcales bacterium]
MFETEGLVADLRRAVQEKAPQLAVREVVARAMALPAGELSRALGPCGEAELKTLFRSPEMTVLKVIWSPGLAIWPHDHGLWAVIGVYGGLEENRYFRRVPKGLEHAGDRSLNPGDAIVLGDQIIHAVRNPRDVPTATIHVYGGDFFTAPRSEWDEASGRESPSSGERTRELFSASRAASQGIAPR